VDLQLKDRAVVITGGTSGIGLAAARTFLDEGASVAFCARTPMHVTSIETELKGRYGAERVLGRAADVVDAAAIDRFRDAVQQQFGKTDILVLSAGEARLASFGATDDAAWREELDLKFYGFIHPVRAFEALLRASDAASIVSVSSILAKEPDPKLAATGAARAGTVNLARSLSREWAGAGIRVNSLLLGVIDGGQWERRFHARVAKGEKIERDAYYKELATTRGIAMGRVGRAEEVAAAIAFLASPLSGFTTGATIEIAGGTGHAV
jgi:NAD(P)-dependent dehydrogenase (short-subunit alcohol dehydrogenase family)